LLVGEQQDFSVKAPLPQRLGGLGAAQATADDDECLALVTL